MRGDLRRASPAHGLLTEEALTSMPRVRGLFFCLVLLSVWVSGDVPRLSAPLGAAPSPHGRLQALTNVPLAFEPNRGQSHRRSAYVARGRGYAIEIGTSATRLHLAGQTGEPAAMLEMTIVGGSRKARIVGVDPLPGRSHYLVGQADRHLLNVPHVARVEAHAVFPGIDVAYYGKQGSLEYDFILAPGAEVSRIALQFRGQDSLTLSADGDLVFQFGARELRQPKPVIYQLPDRTHVDGRFVLDKDGTVRFDVPSWDRRRPLVIDPTIIFTASLGAGGSDVANAVAVDGAGNVFVTGTTSSSTGFPTTGGVFSTYAGGPSDAFVTKFNPAGTAILYSTYLGSSAADEGRGIAVDSAGRAYVTGSTSGSFPGSSTPCQGTDGFVTRVEASGNAIGYARCFGSADIDAGNGIAVDGSHRAYVTGVLNRVSGLATSGDAFVARVNAAGTTFDVTMLTGNGHDEGAGIAADTAGNICVAGTTSSANFPVASAAQPTIGAVGLSDAFVVKADAAGVLAYATYLGGAGIDRGSGAAIDAAGKCYVTGSTESTNFPIDNATQSSPGGGGDAFVAAFSTSGSVIYSTYLGGSQRDTGAAIAAASNGVVHVTGVTESQDLPVLGPVQPELADASVVFASFGFHDDPRISRTLAGRSVTALALYFSTAFAGTKDGVFKTTDGGLQWTRIDSGFPSSHVRSLLVRPSVPLCQIYAGLELEPSTVMPRPLAVSEDCGQTWNFFALGMATAVRSLAWNNGPFTDVFYAATETVDPLHGTVDHKVVLGSPLSGPSLQISAPGSGEYVLDGMMGIAEECNVFAGDSAGRVLSSRGCQSVQWQQVGDTLPGPVLSLHSFAGEGDALGRVMVAATRTGVFRRHQNGPWTKVLDSESPIRAVKGVGGRFVFAGSDGGILHKSSDAGLTWKAVASTGLRINDIAVDRQNPFKKIYVSTRPDTDAFLMTLDAAGARTSGTWLGGPGTDAGRGIALAPDGHPVIVGAATTNAFVAKIDSAASVNPRPTLTQLTPAAIANGGPSFLLTVTGTDFVNGAVVRWNGNDRPTVFVDSTHLNAAIYATDRQSPGPPQVTVVNPGPGGGESPALTMSLSPPTLTFDKASLNFGLVVVPFTPNWGYRVVHASNPQTIRLTQVGTGDLTWEVASAHDLIRVSPMTGEGSAILTISPVDWIVSSLPVDGYVSFHLAGGAAPIEPIGIRVTSTMYPSAPPSGTIDTPLDNVTGVSGAIPFTGWALDDLEVARVMICRSAVGAEIAPIDPNCGDRAQIYVGDAVFIDGARPDVQLKYPEMPLSSRAGWGFMLLTNMLPGQGNGTFDFTVYAKDKEGSTVSIGTRRITSDNANATKPFGFIDTPAQGGTASGASYVNFGWVLTQANKIIPIDGSTIQVMVDGVPIGTVDYNHFRPDIAAAFPGLQNSNGAVGFKILDTTTLTNGLHTISWTVQDSGGAVEGIGSRFFTVSNGTSGGGSLTSSATSGTRAATAASTPSVETIAAAPLDPTSMFGRGGWDLNDSWSAYGSAAAEPTIVRGEEVDRFELSLGTPRGSTLTGYLRVGESLVPLPVGSHLDADAGIFTWAPGVGFVGTYDLVFVRWVNEQPVARREVRMILAPKSR